MRGVKLNRVLSDRERALLKRLEKLLCKRLFGENTADYYGPAIYELYLDVSDLVKQDKQLYRNLHPQEYVYCLNDRWCRDE